MPLHIIETLRSAPVKAPNIGSYRPGEFNRCPGCGVSNFFVGRSLAECARCDTALPLAFEPRPIVLGDALAFAA